MRDFKLLIKNTKFGYLWASQILSQLTINVMNFLLLVKLFNYTGSTIATSFLWVAYALPAILIGPFAAALVDMMDRRKMLMITNLLQALTIFLYAFLHERKVFLLYGVVLSYSFLNQFYVPAESASLPSLVKKGVLPHANGLFFLTQQVALVLGFGLAGVLNHFLGFKKSLFLAAFFLFMAFVSVSFLPKMETEEKIPRKLEDALVKFFVRIMEGYRFIKDRKEILVPFLLLMGLQIALAIIVVNVPAFATTIFNVSVDTAGVLIVVPAGVGAGLAALFVPRLLKSGWRKKKAIEVFLMLLILTLLSFVFVTPELEGMVKYIVGVVIIITSGVSFVGITIPAQTYLQEATPGGLRGRVFGNFWFLVTVATIFPVIFSGAITEVFGVKLMLFILGVFAVAALFFSKKYGQAIIDNGSSLLSLKNAKE